MVNLLNAHDRKRKELIELVTLWLSQHCGTSRRLTVEECHTRLPQQVPLTLLPSQEANLVDSLRNCGTCPPEVPFLLPLEK